MQGIPTTSRPPLRHGRKRSGGWTATSSRKRKVAFMPVIDTDPGLLRDSSQAALHSAEQALTHVEAEIVGRIPELMDTLRSEGPYGYTIIPEVHQDGTVRLPVLSTAEEIRDIYTLVRGASQLLSVEPLVELRGTWYAFHEAQSK